MALTAAQQATLAAVLDRLIPSDENGPGAREAEVLTYVLRRLDGPYAKHLDRYAAGLLDLDTRAEDRCASGSGFAALGPDQQDELLAEIEREAATAPIHAVADTFFELVLAHAREGMFGDPSHGGNAGYIGWDLLGFPDVRRVWTEHDQQLDVRSAPEAHRAAGPVAIAAPKPR